MDDKTVAPFALPPTEQVFGQMPSDAPAAPEPRQKRRGRPPSAEKAPKAKRQGRRQAPAPVNAIDMLAQIKVLRGLSESEFGVVTTIMSQVPKDSWGNIGRALVELVQL